MCRTFLTTFILLACCVESLAAYEIDFVHWTLPGQDFTSVTVADFDDDGILDLITVDLEQDYVAIFRGKGDGQFHPIQSLHTGTYFPPPYAMSVLDLDGDDHLDVICGGGRVCFNAGDGTLEEPVIPFISGYPGQLALLCEDFNADGLIDVVFGGFGFATFYLNNGDRTFSLLQEFALDCGALSDFAAADLNEDGILDVIGTGDGLLVTLLGTSDGVFEQLPDRTTNNGYLMGVALHDFNDDGLLDVASGGVGFEIFAGLGNAAFSENALFEFTGFADASFLPDSISLADFDNDGIVDIATSSFFDNSAGVLRGLGDGDFEQPVIFTAARPMSHTVADLNQDGRPDIVMADFYQSEGISVLLNHTGTLPADVNLDGQINLLDRAAFIDRLANGVYQVEADVNRDGVLNLNDVGPFVAALVEGVGG